MNLSKESLVKQVIDEILRWKDLGLTPAEILGNPERAAIAKRRYVALSRFIHPDKVPNDLNLDATQAQQIIQDAVTFLENEPRDEEDQSITCFRTHYQRSRRPVSPCFSATPYLISLLFEQNLTNITEARQRELIAAKPRAFSSASHQETWLAVKRVINNKNYDMLSFFLETPAGQAILQRAMDSSVFCRSLLQEVDNKAVEILMGHGLTPETIANAINQQNLDAILNVLELSEAHFNQIYFAQNAVKKETIEIVRAIMSGPLYPQEKMHYLLAVKNLIRANTVQDKEAFKTIFNTVIDSTEVRIVQSEDSQRNFFLNLVVMFFRWLGLTSPSALTKKNRMLLAKYENTAIEPAIVLKVELEKILPVEDRSIVIATALSSQNYPDFWGALSSDRAIALLSSATQMAHWLDKTPQEDYPRLFMGLGEKINTLKSNTAALSAIFLALPTTVYPSMLSAMTLGDNPALFAAIFNQLSPEKRRPFLEAIVTGLTIDSHLSILHAVDSNKRYEYLTVLKSLRLTLLQDLASRPDVLTILNNDHALFLELIGKEKVLSSLTALSTLFNGLDTSIYPEILRTLGRSELLAKPNFLAYIIHNMPAQKKSAFIQNITSVMDLTAIMVLYRLLNTDNKPGYLTTLSTGQGRFIQVLADEGFLLEVLNLLDNNYTVFLAAIGKDSVLANSSCLSVLFNGLDSTAYPEFMGALGKSQLMSESNLPQLAYITNRLPDEKRGRFIQILIADLSVPSCVAFLPQLDMDKRLAFLQEANKIKPTFLNEMLTTSLLPRVMQCLTAADKTTFLLPYIAIIENEQMLADLLNALSPPELTFVLENFRGVAALIGGGDRLFTFLERLAPQNRALVNELILPQLNVLIPADDRFQALFNLISPIKHLRLLNHLQTLSGEEKTALLELVPMLTPLYKRGILGMDEIAAYKPEQLAQFSHRSHLQDISHKTRELRAVAIELRNAISSIYLTQAKEGCRQPLLEGMQVKRKFGFFVDPLVPKYRDAFLLTTANIDTYLTTIEALKRDIAVSRTFCAAPELRMESEEDAILREALVTITDGLSGYISRNRANLCTLPAIVIASPHAEKNCLSEIDSLISRLSIYRPAVIATTAVP